MADTTCCWRGNDNDCKIEFDTVCSYELPGAFAMNSRVPQTTPKTTRVLDQISVPVPCPMSWSAMEGDDKVRFCGECNRHVWNFFEMTDEEILRVLRENPARVCAQIVKNAEGVLVTKSNHRVRSKYRFSMLSMLIVATCLSPLLLWYPSLYHWLVREPEPIPKLPVGWEKTGGVVVDDFDF